MERIFLMECRLVISFLSTRVQLMKHLVRDWEQMQSDVWRLLLDSKPISSFQRLKLEFFFEIQCISLTTWTNSETSLGDSCRGVGVGAKRRDNRYIGKLQLIAIMLQEIYASCAWAMVWVWMSLISLCYSCLCCSPRRSRTLRNFLRRLVARMQQVRSALMLPHRTLSVFLFVM